MREGQSVAVYGKEAEWGTDPGSGYTTLLMEGAGLQLNDTVESEERIANASWPAVYDITPTGQDVKSTLKTRLHTDTVADLIKMAVERTNNELNSYALGKKDAWGNHWHLGCKVNQMTLEWSNGLIDLTHEFVGREALHGAGSSITAGIYPAGAVLKSARASVSIAGVAAAAVQSGKLVVSNNLEKGAPAGAKLIIDRLDAGMVMYDLNIKAKMASLAWEQLAKSMTAGELTAFAAVLSFTGTDVVQDKVTSCTFAAASLKAKDAPREATDQAATVMVEIQARNIKTLPTWAFAA